MLVRKKPFAIPRDRVKLIIYDFDGVMTDNKIVLREDGLESVTVNRSDGLAVSLFKGLGIKQLIVSTEKNRVVSVRAKKIGISVIQGCGDKKEAVRRFCRKNSIRPDNVVYVGNDLNDLNAMKYVGYPVCPSDACKEVKNISLAVLHSNGGSGVVRELFDVIKRSVK